MAVASAAEYYLTMAKAQGAPVSIRPDDELLAQIDAWAAKRGLKRHAAILQLLRDGISRPPQSAPETERMDGLRELAQRRADEAVGQAARVGAGKFFGITALGEAIPERKPYQKGTKGKPPSS